MIVYIAGPMTGIADNNYPAFFAKEEELTKSGYIVNNPARTILAENEDETWENYMKKDLQMLLQSDMIVVLRGWESSRGARLEVSIGSQLGIPVYDQHIFQENLMFHTPSLS